MTNHRNRISLIFAIFLLVAVILPFARSQSAPTPAQSLNVIDTFIGTGEPGFSGENIQAKDTKLNYPYRMAVDSAGNMYIADTFNNRIRKVSGTDKQISVVAGTGDAGFSGDGGRATEAKLNRPYGVAVDASGGNVYIADTNNHVIRKVNSQGKISTIAGILEQSGSDGEFVDAKSAKLNSPYGVSVDSEGNVYVADTYNNKIRMISAVNGNITTVAGTGVEGFSGDIGLAKFSKLSYPRGIFFTEETRQGTGDKDKILYVADTGNSRIRAINLTDSTIKTIAGGFLDLGIDVNSVKISKPDINKKEYSVEATIENPSSFAREFYVLAYVTEPDGSKTLSRNGDQKPVKIEAGSSKSIALTKKPVGTLSGDVGVQIELREVDGRSKDSIKGVFPVGQTTELEKFKSYSGTRYGISFANSNKNIIGNNTITLLSPSDAGVYLSSSKENALQSNIVDSQQQSGHGIVINSAADNALESNRISVAGRKNYALYISGSSNTKLAGDKIESPPLQYAIRLKSSPTKFWNVDFRKDTILFDDASEISINKSLVVHVVDGTDPNTKIANAVVEIFDETTNSKVFSENLASGEKRIQEITESRVKGVKKTGR